MQTMELFGPMNTGTSQISGVLLTEIAAKSANERSMKFSLRGACGYAKDPKFGR